MDANLKIKQASVWPASVVTQEDKYTYIKEYYQKDGKIKYQDQNAGQALIVQKYFRCQT